MIAWTYWAVLLGLFVLAVVWRLQRRRALNDHAVRLGWPALTIGASAIVGLVFHCVAMFVPRLVPPLAPLQALSRGITELGVHSQFAYWLPAVVLLVALRGLAWPMLAALAVALLAVGATMFWPVPLAIHLTAIFVAATLVIVLATQFVTFRSTPHHPH